MPSPRTSPDRAADLATKRERAYRRGFVHGFEQARRLFALGLTRDQVADHASLLDDWRSSPRPAASEPPPWLDAVPPDVAGTAPEAD